MTVRTTLRQLAISTRLSILETMRATGLVLGFTVILPIGILFFLNVLVPAGERTQIVVGTIMMEMALININVLAQTMGSDKESRFFDLWVSLPVNPAVYTLSNALGMLPFSLASALVTLGVAVYGFGVPLAPVELPLLLGGLILVWASTTGIGFLIGAYGRSPRQINAYAQLVGVVLTFFAPVFYPVSILPLPLRYVAYAWPLTWGSTFLVAILRGTGPAVLAAGSVLVGFVALWWVLIGLGVRWRQT
jgi:ABC-2 type transport system permease protein